MPNEYFFWMNFRHDPVTDCLVWKGKPDRHGYGRVRIAGAGSTEVGPHKMAWLFKRGSIPTGLNVLHKCDNPLCGNVEHLYLGTQADNAKDARDRNRIGLQKLTWKDVEEIRNSDLSNKELAAKYTMHSNSIGKVRRGETWREPRNVPT